MRDRVREQLSSFAALFGVLLYLFPIYWMVISGFKTQAEIFADPPTFFPRSSTFESLRYVISHENIGRYLLNSIRIAAPVMIITVALSAIGAYAMNRLRSRLVDIGLLAVLILQVFPEALLATPVFIIFKSLDLLNTFTAVILAASARAVAFGLIILRPMFAQMPIELEEASAVDGCTRLQTFLYVVLPLMRVPLFVVAAITFTQAYGQFVYPLALLNRQDLQPGTVGIFGFIGAEIADWHRVMAFATIFVAPVLLLFLLLQRQIVAGLTGGALK